MTRARSTPSSRANRRIDGLACAREKPGSSTAASSAPGAGGATGVGAGATARIVAAAGGAAGGVAAAGATAGATAEESAAGFAVAAAGAAAVASPLAATIAIRSPFETRSPRLTFNSRSTPAALDGTSIVAFSVSSVSSDCSSATVSPALTATSMTSTSLYSPRSGTRTSMSCGHGCAQTVTGFGLAGSMPKRCSALRTVAMSSWPSSASTLSAASAT